MRRTISSRPSPASSRSSAIGRRPPSASSSRASRGRLHPLIRDEVYRIGREALVNAFRHAGASAIEVELEYGASELRLFVRDDGRRHRRRTSCSAGSDGHWGLPGMRERAERIGASLAMRTRQGAGTEIELRVPGRVAFARDAPARRGAPPAGAHSDDDPRRRLQRATHDEARQDPRLQRGRSSAAARRHRRDRQQPGGHGDCRAGGELPARPCSSSGSIGRT